MSKNQIVFSLSTSSITQEPYRIHAGLLTPDECAEIIRIGEPQLVRRRPPRFGKKRVDGATILPDQVGWLYPRLASGFLVQNPWGFQVSGLQPASLLRYGPRDSTRMHVDYKPHYANFAKITAVVQLVPPDTYAGGKLHITEELDAVQLACGDCVFFPSIVMHGVTPVRRGHRFVLAAWAAGPPLA